MKSLALFCTIFLVPVLGLAQEPPADRKQQTQEKLDQLIVEVQDQIEMDPMMRGVILTGAKFVPNMQAPGEVLQLEGKIMDPAQGQKVVDLVKTAMGKDKFWSEGEGGLEWSATTMTPSLGSIPLANRYYAQGLEYFWKAEYSKADRAFARALAEAPDDDVLRYWRAVSALAQKQEDRAKSKLKPLMEAYPLGSRTPNISASFERLQGPLRQQLMKMENEILASL